MNKKARRAPQKHPLILFTAAGALAGTAVSALLKELPASFTLPGGLFGVLSFSPGVGLFRALFLQFLPLLAMYLFAFGALALPASSAVLFARAFLGSAGCVCIFRSFCGKKAFLPFFLLLCLMETTVLLLCHSCGKLSVFFYEAIGKSGVRKRALFRYTSDILFFAGLIFILFLLRGCLMALIVRLK